MEGYVMNITSNWMHAMKRAIAPGAKVSLSELYDQYGVKYNLKEGAEFVDWLKNVKLRSNSVWKIVFNNGDSVDGESCIEDRFKKVQPNLVTPMVKTKISVTDVVNMSVRTAREEINKINDLKLLKYALQEANQLAGKDSLCIIIRKRIKELQSVV